MSEQCGSGEGCCGTFTGIHDVVVCDGKTFSATPPELWPLLLFLLLQEECQNYVRVLIVTGRKLFVCGTNAFSPVCSSRQVGDLEGQVGGRGHDDGEVSCPGI